MGAISKREPTGPDRNRGRAARRGFNLLEILAVVAIVGVVAAIAIGRLAGNSATAKKNACYVIKRNVEVQVQLWYRTKAAWPAANLADIGADVVFFPEGLPTCPVDGSSYTIDAAAHQVVGHTH